MAVFFCGFNVGIALAEWAVGVPPYNLCQALLFACIAYMERKK